jgi:hypothetical protein
MKIILLFLLFFYQILNASYFQEPVKWIEAKKACLKEGKRLPTIEELIKIKTILTPGLYWSKTALRSTPSNYEYWMIKLDDKGNIEKGYLDENLKINYECIKGGKKPSEVLNVQDGIETFRAIYKKGVIVFPVGSISFIDIPEHTLDKNVKPYNFYQFQIQLKTSISNDYMQKLVGRIVAYDTILFGKILHVKPLDKYGYKYQILSTPADLLTPYVLPDEALR